MEDVLNIIPSEPFVSISSKRKRKTKKVEEPADSTLSKNKKNNSKKKENKKKEKKNTKTSQHIEEQVEMQSWCPRTADIDTSATTMLHHMIQEMLRNTFLKSGLKIKVSGTATMTPVMHIPVSIRSNQWKLVLPLLKSEEYKVFTSTKRGFALTTWSRTDCVLNELCYRLDVSGDLAIICPIACIVGSNRKCFFLIEISCSSTVPWQLVMRELPKCC